MSQAQVIGRITVLDERLWAEYRSRVGQTLLPWQGEMLMRGTLADRLSGHESHEDVVVIGFPDLVAARGWFASAQYQALIALRQRVANVVLSIYEA